LKQRQNRLNLKLNDLFFLNSNRFFYHSHRSLLVNDITLTQLKTAIKQQASHLLERIDDTKPGTLAGEDLSELCQQLMISASHLHMASGIDNQSPEYRLECHYRYLQQSLTRLDLLMNRRPQQALSEQAELHRHELSYQLANIEASIHTLQKILLHYHGSAENLQPPAGWA
jgi:hypothetical protein